MGAPRRERRRRLAAAAFVARRPRGAHDELRRRLILAAWPNTALVAIGGRVVVVGGSALEFYTQGEYFTADLDLVSVDRVLIGQRLEELGFTRSGRYWVADELNLVVEIPDDVLKVGGSPGDWQRVTSAEVPGIGAACIIGPEDLLVERLLAARYWSDQASLHWARALLRYWGAEPVEALALDHSYMEALAPRGSGRAARAAPGRRKSRCNMTRRRTLDDWLQIVAARKAEVGDAVPRVKRTRARDPESTKALVDLTVARMARKFPELFTVVGTRRLRLRPNRGSRMARKPEGG